MAYKITNGIKNCKGTEDLKMTDIWNTGIDKNGCLLLRDLNYSDAVQKAKDYCFTNTDCAGFEVNTNVSPNNPSPSICFRKNIDSRLFESGTSNCFEKNFACNEYDSKIRKKYSKQPNLAVILEKEKYINCLYATIINKNKTYQAKLITGQNVSIDKENIKKDITFFNNIISEFLDLVNEFNKNKNNNLDQYLNKNTKSIDINKTLSKSNNNLNINVNHIDNNKENNKNNDLDSLSLDYYTNNEFNKITANTMKNHLNNIDNDINLDNLKNQNQNNIENFQNKLDNLISLDSKQTSTSLNHSSNYVRFIIYFILFLIVSFLAITAFITNNFNILNNIFFVLIFTVCIYYYYDMNI